MTAEPSSTGHRPLTLKEQIAYHYRRFCRWQQSPQVYVNRHEGSVLHCHNCGMAFADNFCPRCGQRAGVGRVGWKSIKDNIAILWGLDNRSLSYTLVQLMARPGYLVRDYISGRRQVSFPPIKMLVIVCLFIVLFETLFHQHRDVLDINFHNAVLDKAIDRLNSQKSWAMLLTYSLFILPTWVVFRYAPAYPRHSLPEGFFLQVFSSVQGLIFTLFGYWSANVENALSMVYMYVTYRQLFGYGRWGTLWRLGVTSLAGMMMAIAVIIPLILTGDYEQEGEDVAKGGLAALATLIVVTTVALGITHLINKHTRRDI